MGTGAIVVGLASVIIGEVIFGVRFSFAYKLASVVLGSVLYRVVIAIVLQMGLKSTDLKLLTAIIVALALAIPVVKNRPLALRGLIAGTVALGVWIAAQIIFYFLGRPLPSFVGWILAGLTLVVLVFQSIWLSYNKKRKRRAA